MAPGQLNNVFRHNRFIRQWQEGAGIPGADLLKRYVGQGDQTAFEALVCRHGCMILGFCC